MLIIAYIYISQNNYEPEKCACFYFSVFSSCANSTIYAFNGRARSLFHVFRPDFLVLLRLELRRCHQKTRWNVIFQLRRFGVVHYISFSKLFISGRPNMWASNARVFDAFLLRFSTYRMPSPSPANRIKVISRRFPCSSAHLRYHDLKHDQSVVPMGNESRKKIKIFHRNSVENEKRREKKNHRKNARICFGAVVIALPRYKCK